jgi:phenylacetate-CoA ligase
MGHKVLKRVVPRAVLRLQEAVLKRQTLHILERLEAVPNPDRARLAANQLAALRQLLEHAESAIPYWWNRLNVCEPVASPDNPSARLASIPVLTRAEVVRHRDAMLWRDAPGKVLRHTSSGTTDDNLVFFWGRARQSWDRAMRLRGIARHGIQLGDRVLHLWPKQPANGFGETVRHAARSLRDWLTNDVVVDLRPFTPERLDAVLSRCQKYEPALIIAYPSWLVALCEWIRNVRPATRLPTLRRVMCTGEVLFGFQRRLIEETLGVPVFQEYGSQDAGLIAHETASGVLRLNAEQMIVEILRGGVPARPGELGEIVVTHFFTEIMPFIRYATGDVAKQPNHALDSGGESGLPVFPLPEGRTSDMLATTDGAICPMRPVVESLVEHAGLWDFALNQTTPDRVIVLEALGGTRPQGRRGDAEAVLRSFLGSRLNIEWHTGTRFRPLDSGKKRFVCSTTGMKLIAHDQESGLSQARAWPQLLEQ